MEMRKFTFLSTLALVAGLTSTAQAQEKLLFSTLFPPAHSL